MRANICELPLCGASLSARAPSVPLCGLLPRSASRLLRALPCELPQCGASLGARLPRRSEIDFSLSAPPPGRSEGLGAQGPETKTYVIYSLLMHVTVYAIGGASNPLL